MKKKCICCGKFFGELHDGPIFKWNESWDLYMRDPHEYRKARLAKTEF